MSPPRTLIVLAGGQSRRMGRNKAALPAGRGTLLEWIIARLAPVVDEVIVAGGQPTPLPGVRWVSDARPVAGPLAGMASGLTAMPGDLGWVVACDAPEVEPGLGHLLFARFSPPIAAMPAEEGKSGGYDAVVPRLEGKPQGLCAVYRRTVVDRILLLLDAGERRVSALLDAIPVLYVAEAQLRELDPELRSFRNLNTPDEYEAWISSRR